MPLVRIFAPFAFGYFLSYLFRTVNAVVGPILAAEMSLSAADLGLLTSAYFFAFAAFQLPLGLLLDRYGAKRVESVLLLFAAVGAVLFAVGDGLAALILGRALIGLGVSACLMAAFKAFVVWYPRDRLPLANGLMTACGGLGAVAATAPVEAALGLTDWRSLFWGLAVMTLAAAAILHLTVPEQPTTEERTPVIRQMGEFLAVIRHPLFIRLAPACFVSQAAFNGIQGLWAGPWLRDVAGLPPHEVAQGLLTLACGMILGYALFGLAADKARRFGIPPLRIFIIGNAMFLVVMTPLALGWTGAPYLAWFAFGLVGPSGILMYAVLSQSFNSRLAGRVNAALNLLVFVCAFFVQWGIGLTIDTLGAPLPDGGYAPDAYGWAFLSILLVQAAALVWLFVAPRPRGGDQPPDVLTMK